MRPSRGLSHPIEQPLALTSPPVGLSGTRSDVTERSPPSRLACLLHSLVRVSRRGTGCRLNASNLGTETWTYPCRTDNRKGHAERQTLREHSESGRKPRTGPFEQGTPEPSPVEEDGPVPDNIERNDAISTPRNSHDARSEGYRSLRGQQLRPTKITYPTDRFPRRALPMLAVTAETRQCTAVEAALLPFGGTPPPRTDEVASPETASTPRASLPTVSRSLELSLQSAFHLSLTVLVRYRTRARIQPWMESTTRLGLQSQTTRLDEPGPSSRRSRFTGAYGALTLSGTPFQVDFGPHKDR